MMRRYYGSSLLLIPAVTVLRTLTMLPWYQQECTYCSSQHIIHESSQTPPVHCSVMSTSHQDLWSPEAEEGVSNMIQQMHYNEEWVWCTWVTYMYSIVPQKVWVTVPSWMDSLHRPKSVSFTCPGRKQRQSNNIRETAPLKTKMDFRSHFSEKEFNLGTKGHMWRAHRSMCKFF